MAWVEAIIIRVESSLEVSKIIENFYDLTFIREEEKPMDISLLRNRDMLNDFCIHLTWQGKMPERGKSSLGAELAEEFSKIGPIDHAAWVREAGIIFRI